MQKGKQRMVFAYGCLSSYSLFVWHTQAFSQSKLVTDTLTAQLQTSWPQCVCQPAKYEQRYLYKMLIQSGWSREAEKNH